MAYARNVMKQPSEKSKLALKLSIVVASVIIMLGLLSFIGKKENADSTIIASNFASYDLARAVTKNSGHEVKMLVAPGSDLHHYEPSQQDVIDIQNSKLFIYAGGESESWTENLSAPEKLKLIDTKGLKLLREDGEDEIDEHFWASPSNYLLLLEAVMDKLIEIDPSNEALYRENANKYREEIQTLSEDIMAVTKGHEQKMIVFADRFPAKYFFDEYNLSYMAAFNGCAEDTEADAMTLATMINTINAEGIESVFTIELSDQKLANTVAEQTNVKILKFQSTQNISKEDFESGKTYVDLMTENIGPLQEALQ